ncbi:MAG: 23S rRNA (guanosine(2251)-2'-O)-methyltransferase RlmB [Simkaniaceae bacterium]|nr:23S rRNA (guanosine(2251)-2'-O)-methyltransferase RlmB [Simkaniaceae bacterium]
MTRHQQLVMGRNCIMEVLKATPERILQVYTSQKPGNDPLYQELQKNGIRIIDTPKARLSQLVNSDSHQSYVAAVKERPLIHIKDFINSKRDEQKSLVVMLDSIFDPQNVGAILRSCECFGADLVIYSKNRGTDITPVVSKTSAGASELVPLARVSNLVETMQALQKAGYWAVAAEISEKSESLYHFECPEKAIIIVGSEGEGVQPLLSKKCDFHLMIPMLGQIDSLNVSQATAILLNSYRQPTK